VKGGCTRDRMLASRMLAAVLAGLSGAGKGHHFAAAGGPVGLGAVVSLDSC
jgi:hypothetical protein